MLGVGPRRRMGTPGGRKVRQALFGVVDLTQIQTYLNTPTGAAISHSATAATTNDSKAPNICSRLNQPCNHENRRSLPAGSRCKPKSSTVVTFGLGEWHARNSKTRGKESFSYSVIGFHRE